MYELPRKELHRPRMIAQVAVCCLVLGLLMSAGSVEGVGASADEASPGGTAWSAEHAAIEGNPETQVPMFY